MSNKEIAISLLEQIPDYKMGYIVSFLKGFQMDDEIEDDLFCMKLYQDYLDDPDPTKHESMSIEEFAKDLGVDLCNTK